MKNKPKFQHNLFLKNRMSKVKSLSHLRKIRFCHSPVGRTVQTTITLISKGLNILTERHARTP